MKRPWMPLYVSDFINSEEVINMPPEACGVYIKLLCFNWQAGDLPADLDCLARMVRIHPRTFRRLWPIIQHLFPEINPGRLSNHRVLNELKDADEKSEKSSKAANKRHHGHADALPAQHSTTQHSTAQDNANTNTRASQGSTVSASEPKERVTSKIMWEAWRMSGLGPMQDGAAMNELRAAFNAPGCEVMPIAACEAWKRLSAGWRAKGVGAGDGPLLMLKHMDKVQLVMSGELDPGAAPERSGGKRDDPPRKRMKTYEEIMAERAKGA